MTTEIGIPERKAQEILRRAAELDRRATESVSIETLRAAAREAGIAESSFAAALGELERDEAPDQARRTRRRRLVGAFAGVGAAGVLLLAFAMLARLVP